MNRKCKIVNKVVFVSLVLFLIFSAYTEWIYYGSFFRSLIKLGLSYSFYVLVNNFLEYSDNDIIEEHCEVKMTREKTYDYK